MPLDEGWASASRELLSRQVAGWGMASPPRRKRPIIALGMDPRQARTASAKRRRPALCRMTTAIRDDAAQHRLQIGAALRAGPPVAHRRVDFVIRRQATGYRRGGRCPGLKGHSEIKAQTWAGTGGSWHDLLSITLPTNGGRVAVYRIKSMDSGCISANCGLAGVLKGSLEYPTALSATVKINK